MTKDEFTSLQLQYQQSGKSLKAFLKDSGICYSNYHYWNKKYESADTSQELAPIMFMDTRLNERKLPINYRYQSISESNLNLARVVKTTSSYALHGGPVCGILVA